MSNLILLNASEKRPTILPARYAKGKVVMQCPSNDTGTKTRAMRLAEAFGGRWVHRSAGYMMSPSRAAAALEAWDAGTDAEIRMFAHDKRKTKELLIPAQGENEKAVQKPTFYECGICGAHHSALWGGDCREDSARTYPDELDLRYGLPGWDEIAIEDINIWRERNAT